MIFEISKSVQRNYTALFPHLRFSLDKQGHHKNATSMNLVDITRLRAKRFALFACVLSILLNFIV